VTTRTDDAAAQAAVAWPVRSGPVPPLADGFTTRPETGPGLTDALRPGTAAVLVPARPAPDGPLDWLGPCGKTQLAVHYAETLWRAGDLDLLVWVPATSRAAVLSAFVAAAAAAGVSRTATDADSMATGFAAWLGTTDRPWLVVLDDLAAAADLAGLWPAGPAGRLLVTTAVPDAVPDGLGAQVYPVGPFSSREAMGYLMDRLASDPDQRMGAISLADAVGGAPLALAQASGAIATSALTCAGYRDHLIERQEQLAAADGTTPPAAAVTWAFAVEQAGRLSPEGTAPALLALAALLDGHAIPVTALATRAVARYLAESAGGRTADLGLARTALVVLERAGLLATDPPGRWQAVRISPVVQAAVRDACPAHLRDQAALAAADALLEAWPADDRVAWPTPGLRACAARLQEAAGALLWDGACHPVLLRAGRSLDAGRLAGAAVDYWRELVAVADTMLGPGHPDTQAASEYLASACLAAGRAAEAVPWFQWVLTRRARSLGPDQAGTIAARRSLGRALAAAGQFGDAITVLDEAAGDCERVRGPAHADTLDARDDLAAAYQAAGNPAEAVDLAERTLADREQAQGPEHPDTVAARHRLAAMRAALEASRPAGLRGSVRAMLSRGSARARE
jgi:hypothetical protein